MHSKEIKGNPCDLNASKALPRQFDRKPVLPHFLHWVPQVTAHLFDDPDHLLRGFLQSKGTKNKKLDHTPNPAAEN